MRWDNVIYALIAVVLVLLVIWFVFELVDRV